MSAERTAGATEQAIQRALDHHGAGRLSEAERIYREVLESRPYHAEALHLLGVIALQSGDHKRAAELIERAVQAGPATADYHNNLGEAYRGLGRAADAERCYGAALDLEPSYPEAHNNLGNALKDLARPEEAEAAYRRALKINPRYAEAHYNLADLMHDGKRLPEAEQIFRKALEIAPGTAEVHNGLACVMMDLRRFAEAEQGFRQALAINPGYAEAHANLADALLGLGRPDDAERSCRQALALQPGLAQAHSVLGAVLRTLGRLEDAEASFRSAVSIRPLLAEAHHGLGVVLGASGRLQDAERSLRRALELKPGYSAAHNSLANILRGLGRLVEAEQCVRQALQIKPTADEFNSLGNVMKDMGYLREAERSFRHALKLDSGFAELHANLGVVLGELGRRAEAEQSLRRALKINPRLAAAHVLLGNVLKDLGQPEAAEHSYRDAMALEPSNADAHSNLIFLLDMLDGRAVHEQQEERRRWYAQIGRTHAAVALPHENPADAARRLRVGYVSADFRRHSAYAIFAPVIAAHDRASFEVFCYSGVKREDKETETLRKSAQGWCSTVGMSDEALAEKIRRDGIDILVDLSGHSAGNRLLTFARKPAPLQATAWGHATGTGLPQIDYFLADPVLVPADERSLYAEEVVDLPCCVCYGPPEYMPEVSSLPSGAGMPFTFSCVNRLEKISDHSIALWSRILRELPQARLLVKAMGLEDAALREQYLRRFAKAGIAVHRLDLRGSSPHVEHLGIFHQVDLALDPYPHGGGVSTLEALWMGVPAVTLKGSTAAGRLSAAILTAAVLPEWIARDDEEYVRIAVHAARDTARLADLRRGLRAHMMGSVIGDVQRYTRAVETVYRSMWSRWCERPDRSPGSGRSQAQRSESMAAPSAAEIDRNLQIASEHERAGRLKDAEGIYRSVLQFQPDSLDANYNLGNVLHEMKRPEEAELSYGRAVALKPEFADAHLNRGLALKDLGRYKEAEQSYRKAIALRPGFAIAHNNLGSLLSGQGRLEEAEHALRRAILLQPGNARAYSNLGNVLQFLGRLEEAERSFRKALARDPEYVIAYSNLGTLLRQMGRPDEAEQCHRRALHLNPGYAEAHSNLGRALQDLGRLSEAELCFQQALALNPALFAAHINLGSVQMVDGRLDEAERSFRRAMALNPDYPDSHSNLIYVLDLKEGCGPEEQQQERRRWYRHFARTIVESIRPHANAPDPGRRLRVGYVSADFRQHSAHSVFASVLLAHDRDAFEVFCYSGVVREDEATARLKRAAQGWHSTAGMSDDALAGLIRSDAIDILVDLSGHSAGNRLLAFARKPAPVQVTAWGHATGTGLETMDYFLADAVLVPREERSLYAEGIRDLPCCVCFEPTENLPDVLPLPALARNAVTFGCLNRMEKISDRIIALWGRILDAVPESRLLVKSPGLEDSGFRERFLRRLAGAGIAENRIDMQGKSPQAEHIKVFNQVDLGLDPYPHGGGVSTLEALWMGVPVVTLEGATAPSRLSASILTAAEMPEWIAHSDEEYVRIAVAAAQDRSRLASLRQGLRARMNASVIGDTQAYSRAVEAAYRSMWRRWCERATGASRGKG